ncbi:hypothetical protein BTJ49_04060 [Oleiagrimonas sp. MCCC 1A03011]|nr:hypothetical protein BTJ49_04060 [Oleiagrimonas sp. MCCC 1A03011]
MLALWACGGALASSQASTAQERVPDARVLRAWIGGTNLGAIAPDAENADVAIADRVLDGFEAGTSGLATHDGRFVTWGFKFGEGNQQSVAVYDSDGRMMLAVIVSNVVRLDDGVTPAIRSMKVYRERIRRAGARPHVLVFAPNRAKLEAAFPLFARWLQADLLGFNADCTRTREVCALAARVRIPVRAFIAWGGDALPRRTTVPSIPAAPIPLADFVQ